MDKLEAKDAVFEALLPLECFGRLLEEGNFKDAEVNPFQVGVVVSTLVGAARKRLEEVADAIPKLKAVGRT